MFNEGLANKARKVTDAMAVERLAAMRDADGRPQFDVEELPDRSRVKAFFSAEHARRQAESTFVPPLQQFHCTVRPLGHRSRVRHASSLLLVLTILRLRKTASCCASCTR
jgi:hypothetical protein